MKNRFKYQRLVGEIYSYGAPSEGAVRRLKEKCYRQGCSSKTVHEMDVRSDLVRTKVYLVDDGGTRTLVELLRYMSGKVLAAVARKLNLGDVIVTIVVEFEKDLAPVDRADIL